MKTIHAEEFVYQSVQNGDLEIAPDGTIWRIKKRQWDRWQNKTVHRKCLRVRAEHDVGNYFQVRAMFDGVRRNAAAHRLVYKYFHGSIPNDLTVNHEDGNGKNNHPDNLTLATLSEQQLHAVHVLKTAYAANQNGELHAMAKLKNADIRTIRTDPRSQYIIAAEYNITQGAVSMIKARKRWGHLE